MPYIVEDGVRLYYEEMGSGTPILFIHPPGMGHIVFRHQQSLSSHFRIIMYDMRGNGKSSPSNRPITIPLLADDICRLLNTLDVKQAIICGYSSGGSIALEFALRYIENARHQIPTKHHCELNGILKTYCIT